MATNVEDTMLMNPVTYHNPKSCINRIFTSISEVVPSRSLS